MGFDALLGNERLKQNLVKSLHSGRISHFYLISGPQGSGKKTLAQLLGQAILCQGRDKPCGTCPACHKVLHHNHPDFITVTDPEHKNVAVKIVRDIREDVFIRPNEADFKVYLFPQDLGIEGQNALLKILEEPPSYGVFLLLTDNPEKILPTVRSRCTELKMQALPAQALTAYLSARYPQASAEDITAAADRSGGFLGQALEPPGCDDPDGNSGSHGKMEAGCPGRDPGKLDRPDRRSPGPQKRHGRRLPPGPNPGPALRFPGAGSDHPLSEKSLGIHPKQRLPRRRLRLAQLGPTLVIRHGKTVFYRI